MKATLEFTLPDEDYEHKTAVNAHRYRSALESISEIVRRAIKHGDPIDGTRLAYQIQEEAQEACFD